MLCQSPEGATAPAPGEGSLTKEGPFELGVKLLLLPGRDEEKEKCVPGRASGRAQSARSPGSVERQSWRGPQGPTDREGLTGQGEELELDSAGGREPRKCSSRAVQTLLGGRTEGRWRETEGSQTREGAKAGRKGMGWGMTQPREKGCSGSRGGGRHGGVRARQRF